MRFGATYLLKFFRRLRHTRYKKHFIYWFILGPTPDHHHSAKRDRPQYHSKTTTAQKRTDPNSKKKKREPAPFYPFSKYSTYSSKHIFNSFIFFACSSPTYLQCHDSYAIVVISSLSFGYLKIKP